MEEEKVERRTGNEKVQKKKERKVKRNKCRGGLKYWKGVWRGERGGRGWGRRG